MTELLWSMAQAAQQLGVSDRTIARWIAAGRLPVVKIGRVVRIPVAAVCAFMARQTHTMIPLPNPLESPTCAAQQLAKIIRFPPRQVGRR